MAEKAWQRRSDLLRHSHKAIPIAVTPHRLIAAEVPLEMERLGKIAARPFDPTICSSIFRYPTSNDRCLFGNICIMAYFRIWRNSPRAKSRHPASAILTKPFQSPSGHTD